MKLGVHSPFVFQVETLVDIDVDDYVYCIYTTLCAAIMAYSNAHYGAGSGPIFMDDVQCGSGSSQLLECSSRPILSHNCFHSNDAGIDCKGIVQI